MQHARTGLKLEKGLYLLAQKAAAERGQSFAAYVTDLLALDLKNRPEAKGLPDVIRITGIFKTRRDRNKAFANFQDVIKGKQSLSYVKDDSPRITLGKTAHPPSTAA